MKEPTQLARELGFHGAAVIDTAEIVFQEEFRTYCAENVCGQYGINYTCPPDCGTPEEMRTRMLGYSKALVLQSKWEIPDLTDMSRIKPAKAAHNQWTRKLIGQLEEPGLMAGASCCTLCSPCLLPAGEPCRFPDQRFSCLSAYCIHVRELAQRCGLEYDCTDGNLYLFSLFAFQPKV